MPFTLDDTQDVNQKLAEDSLPEVLDETDDESLLELGESLGGGKHKTDDEVFMDPQLYTLEIPKEVLDEEGYKTLSVNYDKVKAKVEKVEEIDKEQEKPKEKSKEEPSVLDLIQKGGYDQVSSGTKSDPDDPFSLIDAFIETNPRIVPPKPDEKVKENKDISLDSLKESDDTASESLAKIYLMQGLTDKALKIYDPRHCKCQTSCRPAPAKQQTAETEGHSSSQQSFSPYFNVDGLQKVSFQKKAL